MNTGPSVRFREGLSDRERQEMRQKRAILDSQREAREMARARRHRRIRSLTSPQVAYVAAGLIVALILALVAID